MPEDLLNSVVIWENGRWLLAGDKFGYKGRHWPNWNGDEWHLLRILIRPCRISRCSEHKEKWDGWAKPMAQGLDGLRTQGRCYNPTVSRLEQKLSTSRRVPQAGATASWVLE